MNELSAEDYTQIIGQLSSDNAQLRLTVMELSIRLNKHEKTEGGAE
jgi:hypothetical protein